MDTSGGGLCQAASAACFVILKRGRSSHGLLVGVAILLRSRRMPLELLEEVRGGVQPRRSSKMHPWPLLRMVRRLGEAGSSRGGDPVNKP